jgi:uncharacterized Zn-binding protein involved in type VI secretion
MSKGASRVGQDKGGGGIILGPGASRVFVEGKKWSLDGDNIAGHGSDSHASPKTVATSTRVVVEGKKPVREGDAATCGHPAEGSSKVFAG